MRGPEWQPSLEDPEIQAYILDEVGEEGMGMAKYLREHPHVSGVDLLESFKEQKASAVRKILYRMMEAHVGEYEKDPQLIDQEIADLRAALVRGR